MDFDKIVERATGGHDTVPDEWMPANGMRPLQNQDPGLLWLKFHGEDEGFERDTSKFAFMPFISQKAGEYEDTFIKREFPRAVRAMQEDWNVRQAASFRATLELMKCKTPAISKAALWWAEEGIYGSCDLICLQSALFKRYPALRMKDYKATDDHYVVMDMKYTSGLHTYSRRDDLEKYACQMRIYSYALGHIQGRMPQQAFIVSRDRILDPIPVEVNQELGKPMDKTLRDFRTEYKRIKSRGTRLKPWIDKEVAVNPGNAEDFPFHGAKETILTELVKGQSLTMLPGVGNKLADALEDAGYECLADLLSKKPEDIPLEDIPGFGPVMAARIRAVLKANRTKKATKIPLDVVPEKMKTRLFVDYEYLSNVNVNMEKEWPNLVGTPMVAAVGVGWEERGRWRYQQFLAASESHHSEKKMFQEFQEFLESKGVFNENPNASLFHYSPPNQTKLPKQLSGMEGR